MRPGPRRRRSASPRSLSLRRWALRLLAEDRWREDRTSRATIPPSATAVGVVEAQAAGVVSGLSEARAVAEAAGLRVVAGAANGDRIRPGDRVLVLRGSARRLLAAERTLLNLVMHASGVATATHRAVAALGRNGPEVWGTRKTLPGLRDLEKAAVRDGGGVPHRRDLSDGLLLKTNHLGFVDLASAVRALCAAARPGERVEVEVRTASEALTAVQAGASAILIDNRSPSEIRAIVRELRRNGVRSRVWIEASGGITVANVGEYRSTGVDAVSLGSLTHSAPAVPFHLLIRPAGGRRPRKADA